MLRSILSSIGLKKTKTNPRFNRKSAQNEWIEPCNSIKCRVIGAVE